MINPRRGSGLEPFRVTSQADKMSTRDIWPLLFAAWLISFLSSLAALFIGEVMGQAPCVLCWFQRSFMFPLALVLLVAALRSDAKVWRYALPLAASGWLVAGFHTLQYAGVIPKALEPCSETGPSCSGAAMTILGGIPIPLLALGAFTAIIVLLTLIRRREIYE
jgi:disulfide bond formation protein DsbB